MIRLALIMVLILLPLPARALLHYSGETSLYEDTVWEGEILIDGILTVAMGVTLEIRPGTRVRFTRFDSNADGIGEHEIFIQGRILARGTRNKPIFFTSAEAVPRPGDWGALNMMMSEEGENLLEYCRVEYGYRGFHAHFSNAVLKNSDFSRNQRGAQFQESTVQIEDCSFEDNFNGLQFRDSKVRLERVKVEGNHWGIRAVYVDLEMRDGVITNNRVNGVSLRDSVFDLGRSRITGNRKGLYLQRSRGQVRGLKIVKNYEHGIYLEDSIADVVGNLVAENGRSGIKLVDSGGRISENQLLRNREHAMVNAGSEDFSVGSNWFGSTADLNQEELFFDRRQRPESGSLILAKPMTTPPQLDDPQ